MSSVSMFASGPWLSSLKGLFFPPECLICNRFLGFSAGETVCLACRPEFSPCRKPVADEALSDGLDAVFALYHYGRAARKLIHRMKLTADPRPRRWLSAELLRSAAVAGQNFDLVVPVPSHRRDPLISFAPQTSLWTEALAAHVRAPAVRAIVRTRTVPKQTSLKRDRRLAASGTSLAVRSALPALRRSVLLADDVLTTGATARACARLLKHHGAERVAVAVVARG